MSTRMDRAIRESGLLDRLVPAHALRQRQTLSTLIDPALGFSREALLPYFPPLDFVWDPGESGWKPIPTPIRLVTGWARAETPPSGGNCIITFSYETHRDGASEGITTITPALSITAGKRFGEVQLAVDLPAGCWVRATVSSAGSAGGVSIGLVGVAR